MELVLSFGMGLICTGGADDKSGIAARLSKLGCKVVGWAWAAKDTDNPGPHRNQLYSRGGSGVWGAGACVVCRPAAASRGHEGRSTRRAGPRPLRPDTTPVSCLVTTVTLVRIEY